MTERIPDCDSPVNSVTSDSHKMTLSSHDVTEQAQVTVVDVQTIEIQHKRNLFLHTFPKI